MNNIRGQFSHFPFCELSEQTVIPLDKASLLSYRLFPMVRVGDKEFVMNSNRNWR